MTCSIAYCDESGQSGPNYLDPEQPFFSLAAWVVPNAAVADMAAAVVNHNQRFAPQSRELKAARLLRRPRGKECIRSLFGELCGLGCVPVFVVAEKRYCVAAKIVETFFDPDTNDKVPPSFVADFEAKQMMARQFYTELPAQVLNNFAVAYREAQEDLLRSSATEIEEAMRDGPSAALSDLISGVYPNLDRVAELESQNILPNGAMATMNLPALQLVFFFVEQVATHLSLRTELFVHDEIDAYESGFALMFEFQRQLAERGHRAEHPYAIMPIHSIARFETRSSVDCAQLQAADLLAGTMRALAVQVDQRGFESDMDEELARVMFARFGRKNPELAGYVCSEAWETACLELLS